MKQLPESFCIEREGRTKETCPRWKMFIEYLDSIDIDKICKLNGGSYGYYGAINERTGSGDIPFGQLLTLDQFEEIMGWKEPEQWQPKPGEMVQVRDSEDKKWEDREFIAFAPKIKHCRYLTYCKDFDLVVRWNHCRPIPKVTTYSRSEAIKLLSQHTGKPESEIEIE